MLIDGHFAFAYFLLIATMIGVGVGETFDENQTALISTTEIWSNVNMSSTDDDSGNDTSYSSTMITTTISSDDGDYDDGGINETMVHGETTMEASLDCANVTEQKVVEIAANGSSPTRVGVWILRRWGFSIYKDGGGGSGEWVCDVKGTRGKADVVHTLGLDFNSENRIKVGSVQTRCPNQLLYRSCNKPIGGRRKLLYNDRVVEYCFRLRVRCVPRRVCAEEERQSRVEKWSMYAYGVVFGFVVGCIVACVCAMCITAACNDGDRKKGECKKEKVSVINYG